MTNNTQKLSEEWEEKFDDMFSGALVVKNIIQDDRPDIHWNDYLVRPQIKDFIREAIQATREETMDTSKINRVEVIDDENGRAYVNWKEGNKVELSFQDENRTLKIFIRNQAQEKGIRR